jgi:hypothetical protein
MAGPTRWFDGHRSDEAVFWIEFLVFGYAFVYATGVALNRWILEEFTAALVGPPESTFGWLFVLSVVVVAVSVVARLVE